MAAFVPPHLYVHNDNQFLYKMCFQLALLKETLYINIILLHNIYTCFCMKKPKHSVSGSIYKDILKCLLMNLAAYMMSYDTLIITSVIEYVFGSMCN